MGDREITEEHLNIIAQDDPVTCAAYAKQHNRLELPKWKKLKHIAKHQNTLIRAINQTMIRQVRRSAVYQFGFFIPRDYKHALELDKLKGNSRWYDATKKELDQINDYKVFKDHGTAQYDPKSKRIINAPIRYQKIKVHLVFACKHDGWHKARLVAGGHLTPDPIHSIYSGVVSTRSLRLTIFLAKLDNMKAWATDIGNAYLEATTKEKLYIIAGPELEELQGHILVIHKALYGLKSSGLRWSQRIHDIKLVLITSQEPTAILQIKGDRPLEYHLGCDYKLDKDGTLIAQPIKYITKILGSFKKMFPSENFISSKSPLEKNDHPELDNSESCNEEQITQYMSMVGQLQWAITLGRYDILAQVMSMSRFRLAPKIGHLEGMKRIYGYLAKTKHCAIRYRTKEPDYSHLPKLNYDWTRTVYGYVKEEIPKDIPE